MDYPESRRADITEVLHGVAVPDPYRWLEDPDSAETVDWVERQNAVTDDYLAGLEDRPWFRRTMLEILQRARAGVPIRKAGHYLVSRNDGSQNQDVWFVADSLEELRTGGRVLLDPNTFSADGTSALNGFTISPDGSTLAYSVSDGGSDWETFHLLDPTTGDPIEDAAIQTKFSTAEWLPGHDAYLYVHFEHDGTADGTQTAALPYPRLRLRRIGRDPALDDVVVEFPEDDQLMLWPEVTDDERYAVVTIVEGTANRNRLWVYPVETTDSGPGLGEPIKVVDDPVAEFVLVRTVGTTLYLRTDLDAERGRLVSVDLTEAAAGRTRWQEVIAESADTLSEIHAAGDGFLAVHLRDAQPQLTRYALDGRVLGPVEVSGGSLVAVHTHPDDPEIFVGLSSITSPTTSYRVDAATGAVTPLPDLVRGAGGFVPPPVTVQRRSGTSADGTAVPYFLITRDDADLSRTHPTLLWGYGGFKIPIGTEYRPGWSGWLAAGGVVAIANLRGGGEFGTDWYEAGRLSRKQNVFDDFIAVAEHLKSSGVTSTEQLVLHGRSNGGLLVGAVLTQRPDLAAVALPAVGVLDLLRFHLFTVGAAWMSDYGDPGDPAQFDDAFAYSPLHRIRPGATYPATLVATGDHDDRVVPLHSHKFTATLQHAQAGDAPVLTRIETSTGHGMGKPTALVAAEWADLLAFAAHHTGLRPPQA